jgi:hypothetical protein
MIEIYFAHKKEILEGIQAVPDVSFKCRFLN